MPRYNLTDAKFVYEAMAIRDKLGPERFKEIYGRGPAKWWVALNKEGRPYDSKAIYAAAHLLEFGTLPDAGGDIFSGGVRQVVEPLRRIGITVVDTRLLEVGENRQDAADTGELDVVAVRPEGRQVTVQHLRRERNPSLVQKKKEAVLKMTGTLACEGCGFVYLDHYGPRGADFIECHHTRFVSKLLPAGENIGLNDLAIVCANCHRMIHTKWPWLTMDELISLVVENKRSA